MKDALEDYFHFLRIEKGLSDNTLQSYARDLQSYLVYMQRKEQKTN